MSGAQQPEPNPLTIIFNYPRYVVPGQHLNPPLTVQLADAQRYAAQTQIHPEYFYAEARCISADVVVEDGRMVIKDEWTATNHLCGSKLVYGTVKLSEDPEAYVVEFTFDPLWFVDQAGGYYYFQITVRALRNGAVPGYENEYRDQHIAFSDAMRDPDRGLIYVEPVRPAWEGASGRRGR